MNRWYRIRHMRGATFLILVGVLALLNQWRILRWEQSWPLFLIVWGLLMMAERAAWTADIRQQQTAQNFGTAEVPSGSQATPPNPSGISDWSADPLSGVQVSGVQEKPFIQTQPPALDGPDGRER